LSDLKPKLPASNDPERFFRTDTLKAELKSHSIRGGAITMIAQLSKFVMQFGSVVVLARLLEPEDYGLLGMVTVIVGFVGIFKDLGLSMATVQREKITHAQISTLFWLNVAISGGVMLLTAALAPVIAWFYKEPRLTNITLVLAIGFIFGGLTVQHQALLKRQMRLAALAKIEIFTMILSIATAISLAWFGAGYWALVAMQLMMSVGNCVGVWLMCGWRPGLPKPNSGVGPMLAFGGWSTGFTVVNYFTRNLDNLLIGKYWGPQELGLYAQAYKLLVLPIQQINFPLSTVALPGLCSLQSQPERYRSYYGKAVQLMVMVGMPIVLFMLVDAQKLIVNLLGPQWQDAVIIFRALAPIAFIGTFNVATGWVFVSLGRTDRQFRWNLVASGLTVIGFLIGVKWAALGVAIAASITFSFLRYPGIVYCYKSSPLTVPDLMGVLWRPTVASVAAAGLLWAINSLFVFPVHPIIEILIDAILYALFYVLCWCILPKGRQTLAEVLKLVKELRPKPKKAGGKDA
jgi:O-antigen/teichoic acid export membrane protein